MAYNKYTWVDGELITAEKLNHMEDGIAEGGSGEAGYECTETTEQLFNETVTTTAEGGDWSDAELAYSDPITADELTVIFNGTEYVCPKIIGDGGAFYGGINPNTGAPDFTNFPFAICSYGFNDNVFCTETDGTHTVAASVTEISTETTECFKAAVNSVVDAGYECGEAITPLFEETVTTVDYGGGSGADLAYSDPITADKLIVLLNGTEYVCPKINYGSDGDVYYGGFNPSIGQPDYTDYPFYIWSSANNGNGLDTETANTYSLVVKSAETEVTNISPCFASAVRKSSDSSVKIKTATLSAGDISVDGEQSVILRAPDDYGSTVGVLTIYPLETEDVYLSDFDCSGDRRRFLLTYTSKQASPVTLDHVECVFTYIPIDEGDK